MQLLKPTSREPRKRETRRQRPTSVTPRLGGAPSREFSPERLAKLTDLQAFEMFRTAFSRMFRRNSNGDLRLIRLSEHPEVMNDLAYTAEELGRRGYSQRVLEDFVRNLGPYFERSLECPILPVLAV